MPIHLSPVAAWIARRAPGLVLLASIAALARGLGAVVSEIFGGVFIAIVIALVLVNSVGVARVFAAGTELGLRRLRRSGSC